MATIRHGVVPIIKESLYLSQFNSIFYETLNLIIPTCLIQVGYPQTLNYISITSSETLFSFWVLCTCYNWFYTLSFDSGILIYEFVHCLHHHLWESQKNVLTSQNLVSDMPDTLVSEFGGCNLLSQLKVLLLKCLHDTVVWGKLREACIASVMVTHSIMMSGIGSSSLLGSSISSSWKSLMQE